MHDINSKMSNGFSHTILSFHFLLLLLLQPAVLEWYRSRREKEDLLKEAIATHDGNAIITVLLFIEKTLCRGV